MLSNIRLNTFFSVFNINSSSVQQVLSHPIFLTSGSFPCSHLVVAETLIQFWRSSQASSFIARDLNLWSCCCLCDPSLAVVPQF